MRRIDRRTAAAAERVLLIGNLINTCHVPEKLSSPADAIVNWRLGLISCPQKNTQKKRETSPKQNSEQEHAIFQGTLCAAKRSQ